MILVDIDNSRIVCKTETVEKARFIAAIMKLGGNFDIIVEEKRAFAKYTANEIYRLYVSAYGTDARDPSSYSDALTKVFEYASELDVDERTVDELKKKLRRDIKAPSVGEEVYEEDGEIVDRDLKKEVETTTEPVSKQKSTSSTIELKRPTKGVTAKVWEVCDECKEYVEKHGAPFVVGDKDFRAAVIAACELSKIHPSTAATQYSKWKRFTLNNG